MINKRTLNAREQTLVAKQSEGSDLHYVINYAPEISNIAISTSEWSSKDSGVTITSDALSGQLTTARLTGNPGRYRIVNKITLAGGEVHERYIDLTIMENDKYYNGGYGYYGYGWH